MQGMEAPIGSKGLAGVFAECIEQRLTLAKKGIASSSLAHSSVATTAFYCCYSPEMLWRWLWA